MTVARSTECRRATNVRRISVGARGIAFHDNQHAVGRERGSAATTPCVAAGCADDEHALRASANTFVHRARLYAARSLRCKLS